jgi:Zn-dependent protease with chaperone function
MRTLAAFAILILALGLSPPESGRATHGPQPSEEASSGQSRPKEYSRGRYALYFADTAWGLLILLILLATGLSARFRDWARHASGHPSAVVFLYFVFFLTFVSVLSLPLDLYGGYFREKRFGFANQTLAGWMGDWGKSFAVSLVFGGLFLIVLYAVMRKLPKTYWLAGSAVAILFVIVSMAVYPVFIAPLFNRFTPLPECPLKEKLLAMAQGEGIPARDVYEVDASRQSAHTNAYVAGLLGTQRIVLYDTILKTDTPAEIETVMAHEMGHYVLHHVWKMIAFLSVLILAAFWLISRLYPVLAVRFAGRWGFREISDVAGLPLLLLLLGAMQFLATPGINAFSRHLEHEADAFSLRVTKDPDDLISAFRKFNTIDLSEYDPPPFIEFWLYTHPSLEHRIEFAERWKKEQNAAPPGL